MPDGLRDLLLRAEDQFEPSPAFVERLARELEAVNQKPPNVRSQKNVSGVLVGMSAAAVAVVLGTLAFLGGGRSVSPDLSAEPEAAATSTESLPSGSEAAGALPLSMAKACDSFLIDIGSMLWTGNGRSIAYPTSTSRLSAAPLYEIRDSLTRIAELHQLKSPPTSPTYEILSMAIGEFGQAALFVQLGEQGLAQHHVDRATAVLDDLSGAPGLRGCLEL